MDEEEKCVVCGSTDLKHRPYARLWCSYNCAIEGVGFEIQMAENKVSKLKNDLAVIIQEKERHQRK